MPDLRDFLPPPPWKGPPVPRGFISGGRARKLAEESIFILSQRHGVRTPKLVFRPMEYTEARFRAPASIWVDNTFEKIVDIAQSVKWDEFLKTVIAHEFKHYLQYLELGYSLSKVPEKEYIKYEQEAEAFGLEFSGISFVEMSKMIAVANGVGALCWVHGVPIEKAIRIAEAEVEEGAKEI